MTECKFSGVLPLLRIWNQILYYEQLVFLNLAKLNIFKKNLCILYFSLIMRQFARPVTTGVTMEIFMTSEPV